jgi:amphi-Trp domain-containing protein
MTEDRDVEISHELTEFVTELRRLADALERGDSYMIEVDGEEVAVPADAQFFVAHEREDGMVELEFQISWTEADDTDDADSDEAEESEEVA